MVLVQYGDYFYLYVLIISLIPAILLGIFEKPIKYYGFILSVLMVIAIMGIGKLFPLFLLGEIVLIKAYSIIRKKTDNRYIYFIALFCSMLPLIICKLSGLTNGINLGFLGLSYLNFKAIQMVIEIYDGAIEDINLFKILYFFLFFPTLSSGPVDRSRRFEKDLQAKISREEYLNSYLLPGIKYIIQGILYKFIIASIISSLWMNKISIDITFLNSLNYMYAYSLYLFFDFAGYSNFAIGTGYILGIKVPINFNKPFISKDMKEFWNRWHISLSKWFGDYIYSRFVLNSMRKKRFKNRIIASHFGQILTMLVMGFWHGITWYYIIYGLYQGIALVLTDIYQRKSKFYKSHKKEKWFKYTQILITFHIACFGLLIFSGYLFGKS